MKRRPIYYDTETTGVRSTQDRIIELAAYDPELNRTFERLIKPDIHIPAEATAIHKITNEMVADADPFSVVGKEFIEFCEGDTVLIAHNNDAFDLLFLKEEFKRNQMEFPAWHFLDTLKWARKYRPDLPRHSLQFLREIYGIAANNAHRALDDVVVLHQMFSKMLDDLTIDQACALLQKPVVLTNMPFGKHAGVPLADVPGSYVRWLSENEVFEKQENQGLKEAFIKLGLLNPAAAAPAQASLV